MSGLQLTKQFASGSGVHLKSLIIDADVNEPLLGGSGRDIFEAGHDDGRHNGTPGTGLRGKVAWQWQLSVRVLAWP